MGLPPALALLHGGLAVLYKVLFDLPNKIIWRNSYNFLRLMASKNKLKYMTQFWGLNTDFLHGDVVYR